LFIASILDRLKGTGDLFRKLRKSLALAMTGVQRENMQWWETISDQWILLIAAGIFVVFVAALAAYSLNKPKQHDKTKSNAAALRTAGRQPGELILEAESPDPHFAGPPFVSSYSRTKR
jgi:hypothetical protein